MRVTITVASLAPEYGGPSAKALSMASALRAIGHSVTVVGAASADGDGVAGLGAVGRFHATPVPRRLRPLIRAVRRCDVLHVLGVRDPVGTAAAVAALAARVPYVLEPAGMLQPRLRSFRLKRAFDAVLGGSVVRGASVVVATSAAEGRELAAAGVPVPRVRVRYNGVDLNGLWPLPERGRMRARLGISPDAPLLLSVGRIAAIKGLIHVARAVANVDGVHWVVAGPDERDGTLESLRAVLQDLNVAERVTVLTDGLWGPAKAEALADADAFCMASQNESFGSAAAEAACAGLPLAITETCGVLDCVEPAAVRTFAYGDVERVTAAVAWAVREPTARHAAAESAARVRHNLDWRSVAHEQAAIYEAALDGHAPPVLLPWAREGRGERAR